MTHTDDRSLHQLYSFAFADLDSQDLAHSFSTKATFLRRSSILGKSFSVSTCLCILTLNQVLRSARPMMTHLRGSADSSKVCQIMCRLNWAQCSSIRNSMSICFASVLLPEPLLSPPSIMPTLLAVLNTPRTLAVDITTGRVFYSNCLIRSRKLEDTIHRRRFIGSSQVSEGHGMLRKY